MLAPFLVIVLTLMHPAFMPIRCIYCSTFVLFNLDEHSQELLSFKFKTGSIGRRILSYLRNDLVSLLWQLLPSFSFLRESMFGLLRYP